MQICSYSNRFRWTTGWVALVSSAVYTSMNYLHLEYELNVYTQVDHIHNSALANL